jgi:lycopene cyclase domain-containing protein
MTLYAWLMLLSIAGPLALSFDKKVAFYKQWKALSFGILSNALLFIIWDIWFTQQKIWGFNPDYSSSLKFWGLPIEEFSFFIVVPYASVFIYACLKVYLKNGMSKNWVSVFNYMGLFLCLIALFFFNDKTYTLVNTSIAFVLLASHQFYFKKAYMAYFWIAYLVHLLPFIIINGVLTGAITPNPIVWYSSEDIIGIRFITIPIEDFIYALSCLLIPITVMEAVFSKKTLG